MPHAFHELRHRVVVISVVLGGAMLTSSCTQQTAKPAAEPASPAPQALHLPLPLVDVMRASVEIPADGIWALESASKPSDADWLLVDQESADLAAAATLILIPGTGKDDQKGLANVDWQGWAADVQKTALQIRDAVKAKDQMALSAAADHLADTCQSCHDKYRPATPSDGVARYPFYPKRVLAK